MDLSRVIIGSIVTEKAERIKQSRNYTLKVRPAATKVDVQNALKQFFDVDVTSIRVMRVGAKSRAIGAGRTLTKRHAYKKMVVTLNAKSKALDLSNFKS
jgi:ribosomal protein L23